MAEQELKKISQAELDEILEQHKLWLESEFKKGEQANLSFCDLRKLYFPPQTQLWGAKLVGANLKGVNLTGSNFSKANLIDANLIDANLKNAYLMHAYLMKAYLYGANFVGASLTGADITGAFFNRTDLVGANVGEVKGLEVENSVMLHHSSNTANFINMNEFVYSPTVRPTEENFNYQLKINELEKKLSRVQAENNQSQEQQEKIVQLEKQIELAKQELQQLKNIDDAHYTLTKALTNTETQIKNNQEFSKLLGQRALWLISLDIAYIVIMPFVMVYTKFYDLMANKVGMWGILFLTFPALLILLIALALLRHQKQLIAEIRHYSMLKHKIELCGGILKAAHFIAFAQNSEEDNFIKNTFHEIKTELLKSPNFDLNSQPQIFPEENMLMSAIEKAIEKLGVEFVKKNTETTGKS